MTNKSVQYARVNSVIVPCGKDISDRNKKMYLQVGDNCFLIQAEHIGNEVITMAMKEARFIVMGIVDKEEATVKLERGNM